MTTRNYATPGIQYGPAGYNVRTFPRRPNDAPASWVVGPPYDLRYKGSPAAAPIQPQSTPDISAELARLMDRIAIYDGMRYATFQQRPFVATAQSQTLLERPTGKRVYLYIINTDPTNNLFVGFDQNATNQMTPIAANLGFFEWLHVVPQNVISVVSAGAGSTGVVIFAELEPGAAMLPATPRRSYGRLGRTNGGQPLAPASAVPSVGTQPTSEPVVQPENIVAIAPAQSTIVQQPPPGTTPSAPAGPVYAGAAFPGQVTGEMNGYQTMVDASGSEYYIDGSGNVVPTGRVFSMTYAGGW